MISTQYRLRLEFICKCIVNGEDVKLEDMIWAEKLSKANTTAREMLKQARRTAANPDMQEGSMDDFMNRMGLGDPDPSNHKTGFSSPDEIVDWFKQDRSDDWRQRD
ncbi:gp136 [Synechococcus phage S-CBM2]|nr:gp136 [Synechococcus phage S-CBM2]